MIEQSLWSYDQTKKIKVKKKNDWTGILCRAFVFIGTAILSFGMVYGFHHMLSLGGMTALQWALLVFFALNIIWLSLSFMTAITGFFLKCLGISASVIKVREYDKISKIYGKAAILIPVYHEDTESVFGAAIAVHNSLNTIGARDNFEIHILSDSKDKTICDLEERAYLCAQSYFTDKRKIFYRRRTVNTGKKAGNVGEWVTANVSQYDYMIVFDADSLMTGESIVSLTDAMEQNTEFGLIQTVPQCLNRNSIFARMQQFAGQVYGKISSAGLSFWHRGASNFWGHNAIIRVKAFHDNCGLPVLSGKPPFGGPILSHDFVEAALLRRAGWRVGMVPEMEGSYEESPPSLIDYAQRDRRWCQGNLQHTRLICTSGLHPLSRIHLIMGIMSYLSTFIWMLFLVTGLYITLLAQYHEHVYFRDEFTLFPIWPRQDSATAFTLLIVTFTLLLLPKVLGFLTIIFNNKKRKEFGGTIRLTLSVIIETILSSLIAPIMMILQSTAIMSILLGRDSGWNAQRRDDGTMPLKYIMQYHFWHMVIGIVGAITCSYISLNLLLWMSPLLSGLILSGFLSALTARRDLGQFIRDLKIFVIPEEQDPPKVLIDTQIYREELHKKLKIKNTVLAEAVLT